MSIHYFQSIQLFSPIDRRLEIRLDRGHINIVLGFLTPILPNKIVVVFTSLILTHVRNTSTGTSNATAGKARCAAILGFFYQVGIITISNRMIVSESEPGQECC